jgi:hypothetical protein
MANLEQRCTIDAKTYEIPSKYIDNTSSTKSKLNVTKRKVKLKLNDLKS